MNSSINRYHLFSCSTVLILGRRKFLQEYGLLSDQWSITYFGKMSSDYRENFHKKEGNEQQWRKKSWESNCLLFNSQIILPHIAKWKNALKCIITEQTLMKTIRPQWNWFKKRLGKILVIYKNSQKFKIYGQNDQTSIVITP